MHPEKNMEKKKEKERKGMKVQPTTSQYVDLLRLTPADRERARGCE
jgi:hypothetical protein